MSKVGCSRSTTIRTANQQAEVQMDGLETKRQTHGVPNGIIRTQRYNPHYAIYVVQSLCAAFALLLAKEPEGDRLTGDTVLTLEMP